MAVEAFLGAPVTGRRLLRTSIPAALAAFAALAVRAEPHYLIVAGLGGEERYERAFASRVEELSSAARRTVLDEAQVVVLPGNEATRETLRGAFDDLTQAMSMDDSLIVFLVGHGSFDGEQYKFNVKGPDVTGDELAEMLAGNPARAQLIVNATSASGAVLEKWAGEGRTVITATRSGAERNATTFAEHWAAALSDEEADIDKNGAVSAQEAFDYASRGVAESYETEGTLATEHPQIAGDAAPRFTVARLTERTAQSPEVERLTSRLVELESEIEALRLRRGDMDSETYLNELQALLVQLALVQQQIDRAQGTTGAVDGEAETGGEAEAEAESGGEAGAGREAETGREAEAGSNDAAGEGGAADRPEPGRARPDGNDGARTDGAEAEAEAPGTNTTEAPTND